MAPEGDPDRENDIYLLTRIVEARDNCSFRVSAFQFDIQAATQPGSKPVVALDMRLQWNAANNERAQGDGVPGEGVRSQKGQAGVLRDGEFETEVRKSRW